MVTTIHATPQQTNMVLRGYKRKNHMKNHNKNIVKGSPEIIINSQKYDYNFAKKNTLFFSISEISTLKNNDVSISNIKYTMDLSQKRNAESLGKNGFLSNLHFTD